MFVIDIAELEEERKKSLNKFFKSFVKRIKLNKEIIAANKQGYIGFVLNENSYLKDWNKLWNDDFIFFLKDLYPEFEIYRNTSSILYSTGEREIIIKWKKE